MGDYKKNPKRPYEVLIPNKIRTRLAMHYTIDSPVERMKAATSKLRKALALAKKPVAQKKGSLWSRFTNGVKNFLQGDQK